MLRAWGLITEKAKLGRHRAVTLYSVSQMNHGPVNIPIKSPLEKLYLAAHARRKLLEGVHAGLSRLDNIDDNSVNTVNSGRSNKRAWTEMTIGQFRRLYIDLFFLRGSYAFKPDCASSTESKVDVIRSLNPNYNDVEHYDDDPRTAVVIADLFPNVKVYLVHHSITGLMIPRRQLCLCPNLYVVSNIGEGIDR